MSRSSLFVPACCSKWLNVQLARMIGRMEVEVLEVEEVGGRNSQSGGRRKGLTGGRKIPNFATTTIRRSVGGGREAGQAIVIVKRSQEIRLNQLTIHVTVGRGELMRTGHHVGSIMRCISIGYP